MALKGEAGLSTVSDGSEHTLRLARDGSLVVTDAKAQAAFDENVYLASTQAAANMGTALTATMVTLALVNPASSKVKLRLRSARVSIHSPPAGVAGYVLAMVGPPAVDPVTNTAAVIYRSDGSKVGSSGLCFTAATLGATPIVIATLGAIAATGYVGGSEFAVKEPELICLGPGSSICVQGLTTASTGIVSFAWEEITI